MPAIILWLLGVVRTDYGEAVCAALRGQKIVTELRIKNDRQG